MIFHLISANDILLSCFFLFYLNYWPTLFNSCSYCKIFNRNEKGAKGANKKVQITELKKKLKHMQ